MTQMISWGFGLVHLVLGLRLLASRMYAGFPSMLQASTLQPSSLFTDISYFFSGLFNLNRSG